MNSENETALEIAGAFIYQFLIIALSTHSYYEFKHDNFALGFIFAVIAFLFTFGSLIWISVGLISKRKEI